jgi:hypothetical protein
MLKPLLSASLLVLAVSGCSVQLPAAPQQAAAAAQTQPTTSAAAPVVPGMSPPAGQAVVHPTPQSPEGAAGGTVLAGSGASVDAADNPQPVEPKKAPPPQGIAAGEPNPSGGRIGTTAILTPCRSEFMTFDANGDGWIDTIEWNKAGKADADFKAKDKDANGQLDNGEYGCQDSAPGGVAPDGKG